MTEDKKMDFRERARVLGEHVFRWGLSCQDCTPEDFKTEMNKAIKQVAQAILESRNEALEEAEKIAEIQGNLNPKDCTHIPCKSAQKIAHNIRQLKGR